MVKLNIKVTPWREYEYIPPWYMGYAYFAPEWGCPVFALIPLNFFIRWGRQLQYWWDTVRSKPPRYEFVEKPSWDKIHKDGFEHGHRVGIGKGYEKAVQDGICDYWKGYYQGEQDAVFKAKPADMIKRAFYYGFHASERYYYESLDKAADSAWDEIQSQGGIGSNNE